MTNCKRKEVLQGQRKEGKLTQVEDLFHAALTDKTGCKHHFPTPEPD
jgi:hypothetical protein